MLQHDCEMLGNKDNNCIGVIITTLCTRESNFCNIFNAFVKGLPSTQFLSLNSSEYKLLAWLLSVFRKAFCVAFENPTVLPVLKRAGGGDPSATPNNVDDVEISVSFFL